MNKDTIADLLEYRKRIFLVSKECTRDGLQRELYKEWMSVERQLQDLWGDDDKIPYEFDNDGVGGYGSSGRKPLPKEYWNESNLEYKFLKEIEKLEEELADKIEENAELKEIIKQHNYEI